MEGSYPALIFFLWIRFTLVLIGHSADPKSGDFNPLFNLMVGPVFFFSAFFSTVLKMALHYFLAGFGHNGKCLSLQLKNRGLTFFFPQLFPPVNLDHSNVFCTFDDFLGRKGRFLFLPHLPFRFEYSFFSFLIPLLGDARFIFFLVRSLRTAFLFLVPSYISPLF